MPTPAMQDLIRDWDGLAVVARYDRPSEAWFFVALHDPTLGPPTGGCRMRVYPRPEDGLLDAMRLARGMTFKWAGVGIERGGGKSVIALSRPLEGEERTATLLRFGQVIQALNGAYWGGEDLGTTPADMAIIGRVTRYIHGLRDDGGDAVDPGPYTARGVLAGIRGILDHLTGSPDLAGRTVLVQGLGDVGGPLASLLADAGARLIVSDMDEERVRRTMERTGASGVPPDQVYDTPCVVFAPCAVGGVLNQDTIPRLQCRAVAGAANNQLADEEEDSARLAARGITWAPDYIVNGGGAIALILLEQHAAEPEIWSRIEGIEASVREILDQARDTGDTPLAAAQRRVEGLLRRARTTVED
jgi:leucine dehydrogenase